MNVSVHGAALVEVHDLDFEYPGARALCGVSFTLERGSVTALVGPNGAGKTTLLRCLAGLETPIAGSIRIAGLALADDPRAAHAHLGYLPDHFGLYEDLSVRRCLEYAAYARRVPAAEVTQRIAEVLHAVELADKLDTRAGGLSRGQRQRIALAQAMIHRPELLLLDEPASGLDPQARSHFAGLVRQLQAAGMTLLVSSHILAELEAYCDRMLVLDGGRIVDQPTATASTQTLRLRLADAGHRSRAADWLATQTGVLTCTAIADDSLRLQVEAGDALRSQLLRGLLDADCDVVELAAESERLQDRYRTALGERS